MVLVEWIDPRPVQCRSHLLAAKDSKAFAVYDFNVKL